MQATDAAGLWSPSISATVTLASSGLPSWLAGAVVGQWAQISNTGAPVGVSDYSAIGLNDTGTNAMLFSGCNGGHGGNLTDNSAHVLDLTQNVPAWSTLRAASNASGWDTTGLSNINAEYFPSDGRPIPRHTYWDQWWSSTLNRWLVGGRFWGSAAVGSTQFDGFNPATNDWDAAGTYPARPLDAISLGCRDPSTDILYSTQGYKFTPGTGWATISITGTPLNRGGCAFDSTRGFIYGLSSGDNFSAGSSTINSAKMTTAGVVTPITFNASAAWTSFQSAAPGFIGSNLVYDKDRDLYYFYNGGTAEGPATIYVITPNSTTTWDMSIMSVTGVTPPVNSAGVYGRFKYVSELKCCVMVYSAGTNVYYIRTQ